LAGSYARELSAVERRASTLVTRRGVKKDCQIAWLLRAISCMDLTTLSGDDTGRARQETVRQSQAASSDGACRAPRHC